jgi:hypothetical protein
MVPEEIYKAERWLSAIDLPCFNLMLTSPMLAFYSPSSWIKVNIVFEQLSEVTAANLQNGY